MNSVSFSEGRSSLNWFIFIEKMFIRIMLAMADLVLFRP